MHTPTGVGGGPGAPGPGGMYKFPSVSSIHSMVSMGYLPPGHGYVPKKPKPDKPYGPSFVSVMNRTWRGPGRKYINYALFLLGISLLFFSGGALYFGHRNVVRLRVLRTEVLGALMVVVGILCVWGMFHLIHKARVESNRWRKHVRFQSQGLFTAAAVNHAYVPEEDVKLMSGTYGSRALKEIPRPSRKAPRGAKVPSLSNLRQGGPPPTTQGRMFEKKQQRPLMGTEEVGGSRGDIYTLEEGEEPEVKAMTAEIPPAPSYRSDRSMDQSYPSENTDPYDRDYHEATTLTREVRPSPVVPAERGPVSMASRPMQEPMMAPSPRHLQDPAMPISTSMVGPGLPRPQPTMPQVHRPPPQVFRPSPQAWKAGPEGASPAGRSSPAVTPSPFTPKHAPQPTWSPPVLPPVQRAPVSTMKSPQPTIQLAGATPKKGPMSESEL